MSLDTPADDTRFDPTHQTLTSPRVINAILARHGLRADKGFGQHFLIDPNVVGAVVAAAGVSQDHEAWEVGPGLGVLTRALAATAQRVVTIELDARLLSVLDETLADTHNVSIRHGDALRVDWSEAPPGSRFAANLPYNVGTAVLIQALTSRRFARIGVLLQREVAERLVATAGTPAYGSLSLLIAHHGQARITKRVAPGAFMPAPAVTSAVVAIDLDPDARPDPVTFALVRAGFRHRRKTLVSNLRLAGVEVDAVRTALADLGLPPAVRAEALDLATFRALAVRLPAPTVPDGAST